MRNCLQILAPTLVHLVLLSSRAASAQTFPEVGARAMGMGGAFVAVATGATATYWNPAALMSDVPGGAFVYGRSPSDADDLSTDLDDLAATGAGEVDINSRPADAARAIGLLAGIRASSRPVQSVRPVGAFWSGGNYGISVYRTSIADARPQVDTTHIQLTDDPATGLPFNASRLLVRELRLDDYVLSLASNFGEPRLLFGGNIRYSRGETFQAAPTLLDLPGFSPADTFDLAEAGPSVKDTAWSFDLSTLFLPHPKLRLGVIAKYLGSPKFEAPDGSIVKLEPRWRAGIAVLPSSRLLVSADLDLTTTALVEGAVAERDFAVGGQVLFGEGRGALRAGVRKAIDGPGATLVTGGIGVVGGGFRLDLAVGRTTGSGATAFSVELGYSTPKKE